MAPYIGLPERAAVEQNYVQAKEPGELNYLITRMLIEGWKVAPKYATIHKMYKDFVLSPEKNTALMAFYHSLRNESVTRQDVFAAAALAFHEFYRRVGQLYENKKIILNGDVYREIAEPLAKELDALVKQATVKSSLILPVK